MPHNNTLYEGALTHELTTASIVSTHLELHMSFNLILM